MTNANDQSLQAECDELEKVLFPSGTNYDSDQQKLLYDQYKLVVQSAESFAARRQAINGFFLSLNTFLLAGVGFIFKESFEVFLHEHRVTNLMILTIALSLVGFLLDSNWAALLSTYGKLNRRQTHVLEGFEKYLLAAPVTAQSKTHKLDLNSLAELERRVACTFQGIYVACAIAAIVLITIMHRR